MPRWHHVSQKRTSYHFEISFALVLKDEGHAIPGFLVERRNSNSHPYWIFFFMEGVSKRRVIFFQEEDGTAFFHLGPCVSVLGLIENWAITKHLGLPASNNVEKASPLPGEVAVNSMPYIARNPKNISLPKPSVYTGLVPTCASSREKAGVRNPHPIGKV